MISRIEELSMGLDLGESIRADCPECERPDGTLSITHSEDGVILYQCFRASCPFKGKLGAGTRPPSTGEAPAKKRRRVWEGTTQPLPDDVAGWIARRWGITDPPHWYYTEDYGGRIAMSIRSLSDTHRGWVLRNDGSQSPKALTFVNEGEDALSWYKAHPNAPTVLVEDVPSAVRAAKYLNATALCGTGIGISRAVEIAEGSTRPIIVALDQDATQLSFKWARKYSLLWGDVKVLPLSKDFKDTREEDLCRILTNLAT